MRSEETLYSLKVDLCAEVTFREVQGVLFKFREGVEGVGDKIPYLV